MTGVRPGSRARSQGGGAAPDIYLADDRDGAELLTDKVITGCATDDVAEIVSLGNTLRAWREEILAHHDTARPTAPPRASLSGAVGGVSSM